MVKLRIWENNIFIIFYVLLYCEFVEKNDCILCLFLYDICDNGICVIN